MAFLEGRLSKAEPAANQNAPVSNAPTSIWSQQEGQATPQPTPSGIETNPVGEIVGLLALSSSEAPAYVGSSSGLSLAANLGEMVQSSVWNQFISRMDPQSTLNATTSFTQGPQGPAPGQPGQQPQPQQHPHHLSAGLAREVRDRFMPIEPPKDELSAKLIGTYFQRLHSRYPFLNRTKVWQLQDERWKLAKAKREELTRTDRFNIFKLNLIYAIGTTLLQLSDSTTYGYASAEVRSFFSETILFFFLDYCSPSMYSDIMPLPYNTCPQCASLAQ